MKYRVRAHQLAGAAEIPGSKSHTIRGVLLAALADGESCLTAPLASDDTTSAVRIYGALGAEFDLQPDCWRVRGTGGDLRAPLSTLDVGNSGTTMRVALGSCSLLREGEVHLTGDEQIQRRPNLPLIQSLRDLGADIVDEGGNGRAPFRIRGGLKGGRTSLEAVSSQFLTGLLFACPLAAEDSEIEVTLLNERPYAELTLDWLRLQGIALSHEGLRHFRIPGGQRFKAFERRIPADFSSATFFLAAGALGANDITCRGLDLQDSQGDKAVIEMLRQMGATMTIDAHGVRVTGGELQGIDIDLNDCPDALPMLAVVGCFARGTTRLLNVPQARLKETDRIAVMATELAKLGARIEELSDGLVIHQSPLRGAAVRGHGDHRVVMALSIAGSCIPGETVIDTAEAAAVTFPTFPAILRELGGDLSDD